MREDLYDLLKVYEPEFQARWNDVIHEGFDAFAEEVDKMRPADLTQEPESRRVIWKDASGQVQAMFAYIVDSTDLDGIIEVYQEIRSKSIPLTFVVIEQAGDGERNYDIFRLSEVSYLEHHNRAWPKGTSPDPL